MINYLPSQYGNSTVGYLPLVESDKIQKAMGILRTMRAKYPNEPKDRLCLVPSRCSVRNKNALIASMLALSVYIAAMVYVPKTLVDEFECLKGDAHKLHVNVTDLEIIAIAIGGGVATTAGHALGQLAVWMKEVWKAKSPKLSFCEYRMLSKALTQLRNPNSCVQEIDLLTSQNESAIASDYTPRCEVGDRILRSERCIYLRNTGCAVILALDAVAFVYLWFLSQQIIIIVGNLFESHSSERSLGRLNSCGLDFGAKATLLSPPMPEVSPKEVIEAYVQKIVTIGYFSGATGPALRVLTEVPGMITGAYLRFCRGDTPEEIDLEEIE